MAVTSRQRTSRKAPAYTKRTFFGLAKEIGLMPDDAKEMAYDLIGKGSLKDFTQEEINEICEEVISRKEAHKYRPGRATDRQLYKVREYERLLGWDDEPQRLAAFVAKYYHTHTIMWLTQSQASDLIDSLKNVLAHEQDKALQAD